MALIAAQMVEMRRWWSDLRPYHLFLPYTLVWLIQPLYNGGTVRWVEFAVAWLLFLLLYAGAHSQPARLADACLAGMCLLGAVYVPLNPESSGIFSFAAAVVAVRTARPAAVWGFVAGVNALLLGEAVFFHFSLWSWIGGGSGAALYALYTRFDERQRALNVELRLAQSEIARLAKLAERERITRDLHDVLGHTLSLIALKSELAQKVFAADPQGTLAQTQQIETVAREALRRVRETIHGYGNLSFRAERARMASELQSVGLEVESAGDADLTPLQESVLSMVLEEAVTNVVRHAQAGRCRIELVATERTVELLVQDDGKGREAYDGFGVRGMRERLRLLGGDLEVMGGDGTRLRAWLPL